MSKINKNLRYYFLGLLFLAAVFVWYAVFKETRKDLLVAFLDVGQGDAVFIQTLDGKQIMVDGGPPNKTVLRQLSRIMPFYDRTIDAVILTHPHLDHYGGLINVLRKYKVGLILDSGSENDESSGFADYQKAVEAEKSFYAQAKRGMKINLGGGAYLDILLPVINDKNIPPHDAMVVSKLVYKNNSFLLTGDMEDNLENYLLAPGARNLKSNVLKVGHHGSRTSTSEMFLGSVSPDFAVISAGAENKYGHPHKEIMERLEKFETPVLRTDEEGTIKIFSDGERISIAD
ncbi:MAG: MBL fold metallo-hydrolase [Candidatus Pacebacteria bacterium]|nr:MBL fold metallo-hydrolase [Candidatus Paceibacterota bacterium]NUQ56983.1 MBL fold metallo-hydrolase [Candidatus Paceibacter sp.]